MPRFKLRIGTALIFALTVALTVATTGSALAGLPPAFDWTTTAQRAVPATVAITAERIVGGRNGFGIRESVSGSGFIIDPSGVIVTNRHVIAGAFRITVVLHDGTMLRARLVGAAALIDLAVLQVHARAPLPCLKLARHDQVKIGEPVLAIGNPLGLGTSLSAGIVSALNRNLQKTPFDDYVQTDAAINHGNSGGPLIDGDGDVIGVNTILLTNLRNEGSNGLGFAISATVVGYVVEHLQNPTQAQVGWIGVRVQDVTPNLATAFHLPQSSGFIVTQTDAGSPAQQAGLQVGDIILRENGQTLADAPALLRDIATAQIGTRADLLVWHAGQQHTLSVTIQPWPHLMESRGETLSAPGAAVPIPPPNLGMLLAPITPPARNRFALGNVQGVLVVAVDNQSEAYGAGIRPGDVVENVEGKPVTTPDQVMRLVQGAQEGERVVALLVRWPDGPHWLALHADQPPEPDSHPAAADAAAGR